MATQIITPKSDTSKANDLSITDVTPIDALDEAMKIFQEKADALKVAEKMLALEVCPPAARRDAWRRRRYLAYIDRLQDIKRGLRQ